MAPGARWQFLVIYWLYLYQNEPDPGSAACIGMLHVTHPFLQVCRNERLESAVFQIFQKPRAAVRMDTPGTDRSYLFLSHKHMHGLPDKHNCFPVYTHSRPCLEVERLDHVSRAEPTILLLPPIPLHLRFERQGTWDKENNCHRKFQ